MWAATNGAGVVKISGITIPQIPLAGGNVSYAANSIAIDDFGNVYAGTYGNGLVVLAPRASSPHLPSLEIDTEETDRFYQPPLHNVSCCIGYVS